MRELQPKLKIKFNKYLEPNYLDKHVLDIYYNAYVFNLKTYAKFYKCFFISARDIRCEVSPEKWDLDNDPFLKNNKDVGGEFMNDILTNGTYWPITVKKATNGYGIRQGKHRLLAVQILMKRGLWLADRKLLAVTDERRRDPLIPLNEVFYVPLAVDSKLKRGSSFVYSCFRESKDKPVIIKDNFVIKPVSERDVRTAPPALQHVFIISDHLRDAFFEYRIKTKSIYPPHKAINSEAEWENWKAEDFTNLLREFRWLTPSNKMR